MQELPARSVESIIKFLGLLLLAIDRDERYAEGSSNVKGVPFLSVN